MMHFTVGVGGEPATPETMIAALNERGVFLSTFLTQMINDGIFTERLAQKSRDISVAITTPSELTHSGFTGLREILRKVESRGGSVIPCELFLYFLLRKSPQVSLERPMWFLSEPILYLDGEYIPKAQKQTSRNGVSLLHVDAQAYSGALPGNSRVVFRAGAKR